MSTFNFNFTQKIAKYFQMNFQNKMQNYSHNQYTLHHLNEFAKNYKGWCSAGNLHIYLLLDLRKVVVVIINWQVLGSQWI
jgi:hypothetical protein